jgi:hypothetical protein
MSSSVKTFGDQQRASGTAPHVDVAELVEDDDVEARNVGVREYASDPNIKNILITGGAGFMCVWRLPEAGMAPETALFDLAVSSLKHNSASYAVRKFALLYPEYNVIVFDKLDYCASLNNCRSLNNLPNFHFVKVSDRLSSRLQSRPQPLSAASNAS